MRMPILFVMMAMLALPAGLEAQQPRTRGDSPHRQGEVTRRGPVELLLRNRAELNLSADQVTRLEAIERDMEARNRPLIARLVEIRRGIQGVPTPPRGTPEHAEVMRQRMQQARPLLDQIRKNNHDAMRMVGDVLTSEQKARVKQIIEERRRDRDSNGDRDRRTRRRG